MPKYKIRPRIVSMIMFLLLLLATIASPRAVRQARCDEDELLLSRVFTLGEIEVTAEREESRNLTIEKIPVETFRLLEKNDVAEAVNIMPGITLSQTGARNEKMIYIRGFDIKHVPIYLDGIPIYVPYDGYPDLARFNTYDLSEIVVSKGFASVLYGPNTMGGSINIVSRAPERPLEMNLGGGYGSEGTYTLFANFGSNQGKWYVQGGGVYTDSDHFDLSDDFTPTATQPKGERVNSYRTDRRINLKVGLTPNDTDTYALSYINQKGEKGVPPYAGIDRSVMVRWWRWPYWDKESFYFNSITSLPGKSYLKTRLYYDIFKNSLFSYDDSTFTTITKGYAFRSSYDDYTYGGSVEAGTRAIEGHSLKLAVQYKDDVHREHNEGNPIQRFEDRIISAGIEDTIDFSDHLYAILGIGYDRVETVTAQDLVSATKTLKDFELGSADAFNPQAGIFYRVSDTGILHLSVAGKSRLPSIKDKFSYRLGTALPNPDLSPEKSVNYEFGYQDTLLGAISLEGNLFYSDVSDFVLFKTVPNPSDPSKTLNQNQNIGDIRQYGYELAVSGRFFSMLNGGINYTYIQYENKSTSDKLTNIPNDKVFVYLQYMTPLEGLSLLSSVEYNADRYSSSTGSRVAESYTLLDAKVIYDATRNIRVEAGVDNLTDEDYALDEGFPLEGRSYFLNVRYRY